ncbi:hypothetical protein JL722_7021 [Aureococcus anophagefferens]|nr:hypothetical protein JL722_7021 [Aureococcus anophagefferens]
MLLFSLLMIMLSQFLAFVFAYPIGYCEKSEHEDDCGDKANIYDETVAWLTDRRGQASACFWEPFPDVGAAHCQPILPDPQDIIAKRATLVFLVMLISLPCMVLFDKFFMNKFKHAVLRTSLDIKEQKKSARGDPFAGAPPAAEEETKETKAPDEPRETKAPDEPRPSAPDVSGLAGLLHERKAPAELATAHVVGLRLWRNLGLAGPPADVHPIPTPRYYALRAVAPTMCGVLARRAELVRAYGRAASPEDRDGVAFLIAALERTWGLNAPAPSTSTTRPGRPMRRSTGGAAGAPGGATSRRRPTRRSCRI